MFCTNCGAQLEEGGKFCTKCGAPVPQPNGVSSVTEDSRKKFPILFVLLVALLLAGFGGGTYYFLHSHRIGQDFFDSDDNRDEGEYAGSAERRIDETEEGSVVEELAEQQVIPMPERKPVRLNIRQVDNSKFPEVTFYVSIVDEENQIMEGLDALDFKVREISGDGQSLDVNIDEVYRVQNEDRVSLNLALDASESMNDGNKMDQAKNAAKALISGMKLDKGGRAEIISFDNYVYLRQEFIDREDDLYMAIDSIAPGGQKALYDALYAGLYQTHYESGAKCVICFTDGVDNASSYTFDDVVNMSRNTGIPVFIIGIGEECNKDVLKRLAVECSGEYYYADAANLEAVLTDIYQTIYLEQRNYYAFRYISSNTENQNEFRDIVLETSDTAECYGSSAKEYIPCSDISGEFAAAYIDMDYMLDFSSQREVMESDLSTLSLAQLRIARNEIFARHGRQFRDTALNQWFYSKEWYLDLTEKFSPDDFDSISPSPLSKLEIQNADFISNYEKEIMAHSDIYPNASYILLSNYDLALSKAVLKNALGQMQGYEETDILKQNRKLVQEVIDTEEIKY